MSDETYNRYLEAEEKRESLARSARSVGIGNVDEGVRNQSMRRLGLCGTCSNATIVTRGTAEHNETMIRCRVLEKIMPPDVVDCSSYYKEGQMSLRDMAEIAWYVDARPDPGGYR